MRQHQVLIDHALASGITIEDVTKDFGKPAALLTKNTQTELVIDGVPMSWINVQGQFFCDHKHLTKRLYKKRGLPYPKSIVFETGQEKAIVSFMQKGKSYVCKPVDNTNGIGVVLNIKNYSQVSAYLRSNRTLRGPFLLEEQAEGYDLRIHALGGQLVAACLREPAFVLGDGQSTLNQLIAQRRLEMQQQNPNNFLELDETTLALLKDQNINFEDTIPKDQKVRLKRIANMAQGAIATDVTEELHSGYQHWVKVLCEELHTGYFGLDIMTTDHQATPDTNAWILEVNARADWLHHTFSEVRTHDMAGMILEALFIPAS